MEISVHQRFQVPGEPRERATHASRSVSLILFQSTPAENVWSPCSNLWSAHSQVSAALSFTPGPYVHAGMDLYRWYIGFLPASNGSTILSQSKYWSGGRQVCQTCSTAPVVRYTDSTRVVVGTDLGCCSLPFYCWFLIFLFWPIEKQWGDWPTCPNGSYATC